MTIIWYNSSCSTAAMVLQLQWHLSLIWTPLRQTKVSFNDCMCVYYTLQVHSRRDEPVSLPTLIPEPSSFRGDIIPSHSMKHTPHHHHKTTIHHTLTTNTNTTTTHTDIPLVFPQIIQSIKRCTFGAPAAELAPRPRRLK